MTSEHTDHLARALVADGVDAHAEALATWLGHWGGRGPDPLLVGILLDPCEPAVARQRAFGRLATAYASLDAPAARSVDREPPPIRLQPVPAALRPLEGSSHGR